jgi:hypothetical protein
LNRNAFRKTVSVLVQGLLLVFLTSTAEAASGVVLTVKGEVSVTVNRVSLPARTGFRLGPGAVVTSRGGMATLLLSDGQARTVTEGAAYTLPADEAERARDPLIVGLMDILREIASRGKAPSEEKEPKAERDIPVFYPCNSFVHPGEIRFEWQPIAGVQTYEIDLKAPLPAYAYSFAAGRDEGKTLLPAVAPPLLPGVRYYWKVKSMGGAGEEVFGSALHWFALLEPGEEVRRRQEMKRLQGIEGLDEEAGVVLAASHFVAYGLYHEGLNLLQKRLRSHPEDTGTQELLRGILSKMNKPEGIGPVK